MATIYVCLFICGLASACQSVTVNLNGKWTLLNKERGLSVPTSVPGSMYTAMLANKNITNPLYRDNDSKLKWIGRDDWHYTRTFTLSPEVAASRTVLLVCDGLDTFSTTYINNKKIGTSDNMFLQYVYNIKPYLKSGVNTITIDFQSAVGKAAKLANSSAYNIPPDCPDKVQNGECHVNQIRKEQCSFSWDWGPSFPTQGIWKNIYIQAFNTAVIRELSVTTSMGSGGEWNLHISAYFDVHRKSKWLKGYLRTSIVGATFMNAQSVTLTPTINSVTYIIAVSNDTIQIERWWPNGYGDQKLYTVQVNFTSKDELSAMEKKVGFRTVELVQDPVGQNQGLTFYFKINNVPIFFKGSNWIPADSFQETITKERLRRLLQSAAEVHINSMRVWGGGVYESDDFYELTDELGIMIWQDLMFSVALYPATPDFLLNVKSEVTHQVRRLRHHPSIVLWAGNNENELGLRGDWFHVAHEFKRYYDDYVKLYVTTIKTVMDKEDDGRVYLTSSPSNGKETVEEGWVAKNPASELYGDLHFYDYTRDMWNDSMYPVPRFTSEYGVQAWCDTETLEDVFKPSDFDFWGAMATQRNHHPQGNAQMIAGIKRHMNESESNSTSQKFTDLAYLTQINQAVSIQTESEHYRRWQNNLTSEGKGQTMGALYWQLNDIWQAPTWAGMDYTGKWKMLHYYAKRFFAPVLISPFLTDNKLNVYMVIDEIPMTDTNNSQSGGKIFRPYDGKHDLLNSTFPQNKMAELMKKTADAVEGTLYINIYRWDSFTLLKTWKIGYKLTTCSESVFTGDIDAMVKEADCPDRASCFLYMYVNDPTSSINTNLPLVYYNKVKGLATPQLKITNVTKISETEFEITIISDCITPFVWLNVHHVPGRFSDNGFLMMSPSHVLTFNSWDPVDLDTVQKALSVKSLTLSIPYVFATSVGSVPTISLLFMVVLPLLMSIVHSIIFCI